jgi:hypothetical protein
MILPDNETTVDLLNNEAIAKTIVELLRKTPDVPVTIGVHGDWGAGKSSVLEMVEAALSTEPKVLCIKINGWRLQGFEDAKIALIEGIVTGLIEKRPALRKAGDAVKNVFRRIDWLKIAKKGGSLALAAYTGIPTPDQIQAVKTAIEAMVADPSKLATKENVEATFGALSGLLKPTGDSKNVPEEIAEFRKEFDALLKAADVDQLVVLIDDLDRCLPDTAIETLEAVRLFVFTAKTAFIVGADEAMIEYAVRKHFPDLPDAIGSQGYARNYLEKLIQVPFRIPALGEVETRIFVTLLLAGAECGENSEAFKALVGVAREKLKRPWLGPPDSETVRASLGSEAPKVSIALTLSEQIGPILARGTKGNPRQIKRFLNTLILRQRAAVARGFGDDVKLPVLAKLMLAERFLPQVFDQVAMVVAGASDGRCADLAALERSPSVGATKPKAVTKAKKPESDASDDTPSPDSTLFHEWTNAPAVRSWAGVQPLIGELDLRPYLFVSKERKDLFGAGSGLGHLAELAERLMASSKLAVQGLEPELRRLTEPDAQQLFESVRTRVIAADAFDLEPPGIAGLTLLAKTYPTLQLNLVGLLEGLPKDRLGPWASGGWSDVVVDPAAKRRHEALLKDWSENGGAGLKKAAAIALRPRVVR